MLASCKILEKLAHWKKERSRLLASTINKMKRKHLPFYHLFECRRMKSHFEKVHHCQMVMSSLPELEISETNWKKNYYYLELYSSKKSQNVQ
jgi:hypothetical protein